MTPPATDPTTGLASGEWLELPAERKDGAYPNAKEIKLSVGGERNYTHYYDTKTYTSLWVAYPLEARHMGELSRPNSWSYNPEIEEQYQVDLRNATYSDYPPYARGHLIPNGSRNGNETMQLQTFYVTNSVPQIQDSFNSGIWSSLEKALQDKAKSKKLYIVTGVAFNKVVGEQKTITYTTAKDEPTKKVPIPNYFYKVVLSATTDSSGTVTSAQTVGFWFENKAYSDTTYSTYSVSVDQIEAWTGFDFFPNLPDAIEVVAEQNSSWSNF